MSKTIYCDKCSGEIKYRDDLVTATYLFEVVPYHEQCFTKELKGLNTLFLDNQPLNSFTSNFMIVVAILFSIGLLIFGGDYKFTSILFLIPVIYRIYSYLSFERHLEK